MTTDEKTAEGVGDHVIIAIQDTGIGMTEEDLEKLFIPFERSANLKTQVEGTGWDCLLPRGGRLVHGEIYVESLAEVGSTFMKLPHIRFVKREIDKSGVGYDKKLLHPPNCFIH